MAEQPPEEQGNPEAPPEAAPGPMGAGAAVAAGDVGQAAQATFPQPATSQVVYLLPLQRFDVYSNSPPLYSVSKQASCRGL